ncbi:ABC transporter ATP-binding protein [Salinispira pacifica]|uniref:ABC transporter, ATP-binding protein n=1 Tax=Salinispira pacifica TaxID=1307761 RepID=V5WJG5_9SPIO|nr:ABC transporter ATP-binding protein [Salinispira pacifica]AHC15918.1 ABC transporter, ATP-binding protein [Salinispira pacifica]
MIHMNKVAFGYKKNAQLFSNLDFDIGEPGIYGLLGKNGAGKTTMLKLAAGLLFPHGGNISLFGRQAAIRHPEALNKLSFIPEEIAVPGLSLDAYSAIVGGFYPDFSFQDLKRFAEELEIERGESMRRMSLGQKKKCLLAVALASNTEAVIMDEPTNGLDIPSKQKFRQLLAEQADAHRSFIISTHQVRDVQNIIDPVIILDNGEVVFQGDMGTISEGLAMAWYEEKHLPEQALSWQPAVGGVTALVPRDIAPDGSDDIDLELFFQAVTANAGLVRSNIEGRS